MDIRIGVANVARELSIDITDEDAEVLAKDVEQVAAGKSNVLWLSDKSGRRVGVPAAALAYVEMGPSGERRVGFVN